MPDIMTPLTERLERYVLASLMTLYRSPNEPPWLKRLEEAAGHGYDQAMARDETLFVEAMALLRPDSFEDPMRRRLFKAIGSLQGGALGITMESVCEMAGGVGDGAYGAMSTALAECPVASHVLRYVALLRQETRRRQVLATMTSAAHRLMREDPDAVLAEAASAMLDCIEVQDTESMSALELATDAVDYMEDLRTGRIEPGTPTGLAALDRATGGLQVDDLLVLAARPGIGKTSLGLQLAISVALAGRRVLFFSLEMPRRQVQVRLIAAAARVSILDARRGAITNEAIVHAVTELSKLPIVWDFRSGAMVGELRAECERQKARHGLLDVVIIDHVGYLYEPAENATQEATRISKGLKLLAKDLHVAVVALTQLNRSIEARGDKARPKLSDLRQSGSWEQDAATVLFLTRERIEERDIREEVAELDIAKQRNGPTRRIPLRFLRDYCVFEEVPNG